MGVSHTVITKLRPEHAEISQSECVTRGAEHTLRLDLLVQRVKRCAQFGDVMGKGE